MNAGRPVAGLQKPRQRPCVVFSGQYTSTSKSTPNHHHRCLEFNHISEQKYVLMTVLYEGKNLIVETVVPQPAGPYLVLAECLTLRLNRALAGQKSEQL